MKGVALPAISDAAIRPMNAAWDTCEAAKLLGHACTVTTVLAPKRVRRSSDLLYSVLYQILLRKHASGPHRGGRFLSHVTGLAPVSC